MTADENKALHRKLVEEIENRKNGDIVGEVFQDGYVVHEGYIGRDGSERVYPVTLEMLRGAVAQGIPGFPDIHISINFQVAEDDKVVTYWTGRGTHLGTWLGIPETGRKATWDGIYISRVADGRIVEHWVYFDAFAVFRQIGATLS